MSNAAYILAVFHNQGPLIIGAWSEFQRNYDYLWRIERHWVYVQGSNLILRFTSNLIMLHVTSSFLPKFHDMSWHPFEPINQTNRKQHLEHNILFNAPWFHGRSTNIYQQSHLRIKFQNAAPQISNLKFRPLIWYPLNGLHPNLRLVIRWSKLSNFAGPLPLGHHHPIRNHPWPATRMTGSHWVAWDQGFAGWKLIWKNNYSNLLASPSIEGMS